MVDSDRAVRREYHHPAHATDIGRSRVTSVTLGDMSTSLPALLGGTPVRPGGLPVWPRRTRETDAVMEALQHTGDWGRYHGPHSGRLIAALSHSLQLEHAQLCSSGTAAVELALRGLSIGAGDEVILSAYDFKANFTNVVLLGAVPVLVDCRGEDAQLDASLVVAACTGKTKAVIASHLQGGLVDMPFLRDIANRRGIAIIEDACQAPGAIVAGRPAGAWGDVATLSFGGSKLVTAGRGGAVLTSRAEIAQRIRLYTQRGNEAYPLSEMQAAMLLPQWLGLKQDNAVRAKVVEELEHLHGLAEFSRDVCLAGMRTPDHARLRSGERSDVFYKLGFWYDAGAFEGLPRDRFCQAMRAEGIALDPGFPGLHQIHARRRFRASGELAQATRACASVGMLHHPLLLEEATAARDFRAALDKIRVHARTLSEAQLPVVEASNSEQ